MSKTSLILSMIMTVAFVLMMAPGVFAMNRGKVLRNIAIWLAIFAGLGLIYQNFGPESAHPLFGLPPGVSMRMPQDGNTSSAHEDKGSEEKTNGSQGFTPPRRITVTVIHLVVPENALRTALMEGIQLARLGDAVEAKDLTSALAGTDAAAIILDEAAADKKNLKAFQETSSAQTRIFLLGEGETAWKEMLFVECFPKPLRLGHLLSRLSFYIGNVARARNEAVSIGGWRFEVQNRQIVGDEKNVVRLTEKETALLDYLAQSDAPVGREELLAAVWGHDGRIETHTLETHIYQLRRKLDAEGHLLSNEGGAYSLKIAGR